MGMVEGASEGAEPVPPGRWRLLPSPRSAIPGWLLLIPVALGVTPLNIALGQGWQISTGVTLRETYTDNVDLAPEGSEKSDFITDITPRLSIRSGTEGRGRIQFDLDYRLQTFSIGGSGADRSINHELQAAGTAELLEEMAFVDFRATVGQANITNTGRVSDENFSRTGNRTDVVTYSISPYLRHHLGNYADTELRYTRDDVTNDGVSADSSANAIDAEVVSGTRFARVPWSARYSRQKIDNSDGSTSKFQSVDGTARYLFTRKYGTFLTLGVDDNDFATSRSESDGFFWRLGGTWTPSPRTSLEVGYGEQFSGSSLSVDFSHRQRRTVWGVSYSEDVSTTREIQLERILVPLVDAFGDPIPIDETGTAILVPIDLETLTNEVLVRTRFEGSFAARGRRTNLNVTAFHEDRQFQLSGDEETVLGTRVSLDRQLSRRTRARASGSWQQTDFRDRIREDDRFDTRLDLTHQFGRNVNGSLSYAYTHQDSNDAASEFKENRVSASFSVIF